jgi:HK97 family phage major capsid protein
MPVNKDMAKNLQRALETDGREKEIYNRMTELNNLAKNEKRDFSADEQKEWTDLHAEYQALREVKGRDKALQEMKDEFRYVNHIPEEGVSGKQVNDMSQREIFQQVGYAAKNLFARNNENIKKRDILMTTGPSGGYLVSDDMLMQILAVQPEREIIRPRAMVIPAGDQPNAAFEIPYFDQSSSVAGSVAFASRAEDADMDESDMDFGMLRLEPEEQSTFIQIGKKTAVNGDAVSLGTFIANFFRREKLATEDYMFLQGSGTNQPRGLLNATCKLTVSRNTATDVKFVDVASMETKQLDDFGAIWIANKRTKDKIATLADANDNNLIYDAGSIQKGIPAQLFGKPIYFTTNVPTLGTEGDLMLINPSYYIIKEGRGWELMLYDVRPKEQLLDYVGLWDIDGDCWVANAITMKDSNTYSPVVVLS